MGRSISIIIAAVLASALLWPSPVAAQSGWALLSQAEIDDAHSCFAGGQLMVCAGDKKIFTGISVNRSASGTQVVGYLGELTQYRPIPDATFQVDASVRFEQPAKDGASGWEKKYYVVSDEQLARIIERARRDPEWKP